MVEIGIFYVLAIFLQPLSTTPNQKKVGTVWKMQIKKESSDFQIYFDLYFIADNMNTKYFMFCLVNFMSFVNIHPFLSFRPATHSKKSWDSKAFTTL